MRTARPRATVYALFCALAGGLVLSAGCGSNDTSKVSAGDAGAAGEAGNTTHAGGGTRSSAAGASAAGGSAAGARSGDATAGEGGAGDQAQAGAGNANAAGASEAGGAGGGSPCVAGTTCSARGVVTVCGDDGALAKLQCTDGCDASGCLPTNLSTGWLTHQFMLSDDSPQTLASYSFSDDGLTALQSANALPSVYYLDRDLESVEVTGQFGVETTSDDDFIGFVFGYQDPEHFYLFDWKQAAQVDATCGTAEEGAALKVVSSSEALTHCEDFWNSTGNSRVSVLVPPSSNPTGWDDETLYDFRLLHQPGHIEIEVRHENTVVVSIQSSDDTYAAGKFGFYNYSQEQSQYKFFEFQPKLPNAR